MILAEIDSKHFPHRGANVAVRLECDKHRWSRTFHCGNITTNQADLKGIEYTLLSINDKYKSEEVVIRTSGRYGIMMLERDLDGKWVKNASNNIELIDRIRALFSSFSKVRIEFSNDLIDLREANVLAVKSGEQVFKKI